MKNDVIIITDNKMKEDHELIDDEELKEFFLTEAKLLCHSVEKEESECEKLQILYNTQQKIVKLLSVMNHCNFEMHYVEIYHVFGFYFTEKEGEKKKKRKMSERLESYGQFIVPVAKNESLDRSLLRLQPAAFEKHGANYGTLFSG